MAGEGVAVGVEAGGGEADEDVAGADRLAVEEGGAVDDADDGADQVVVLAVVEAGHLGGLAADEGATGQLAAAGQAGEDLLEAGGLQLGGADVIEEEEGLGADDGDVVDAVVDEVFADGVVAVGHFGDLQFGADAVDAADQNGVLEFLELGLEEAAEAADGAEDLGPVGDADDFLDAALDAVAEVDVDSGLAVFLGGHGRGWAEGGNERRKLRATAPGPSRSRGGGGGRGGSFPAGACRRRPRL